jgi:hypothetical protein
MRITPPRSSKPPGPAPVGARHRAFIGGLHCGRRVAPQDAVDRILRRARVFVRVVRTAVRWSIDVRHGPLVQATAISLQGRVERSVEHRNTLQKTRTLARVQRERTFERMLTTAVRVSPAGVPRPAGGAVVPMRRARKDGASPRLPMAMVRVPAASPVRAEPPAATQVTAEALARAPAHRPPATAWVLPAEELSRVTDHVLRTFDRRVLSYRERTGQV